MIDSVFLAERLREEHREAPLLAERERYLTYLFAIGLPRVRVRNAATMLLHVVQLLKLDSSRPVGMDEIVNACEAWVAVVDPTATRSRTSHEASAYDFLLAARNWFEFQGCLVEPPRQEFPFGDNLSEFLNDMRSKSGLLLKTLAHYESLLLSFLKWIEPRCPEFSTVRISHVEDYLQAKRSEGMSQNSIAAYCTALRRYFGYAEERGWCSSGIRDCISRPRVPRIIENLNGPSWEDVRRVIASIGGPKAIDLRTKALFMLFAIYGFRSAEVRALMLEDIDWRRGIITVRRAKRGRTQQFPLQSEVGEAIALYLEKARPQCSCRALFVTLHTPYRPLSNSIYAHISRRIKDLGITAQQYGSHALRRACATQLARAGTSIKELADFLGHSDMRSVCIYAKYDSASLRNVAMISLRGVL